MYVSLAQGRENSTATVELLHISPGVKEIARWREPEIRTLVIFLCQNAERPST